MQNDVVQAAGKRLRDEYGSVALVSDDQAAVVYEAAKAVVKERDSITDEEAQRRLSAFAWYGGKSVHLRWLLPLLPPCKHFVDVFGGSGAVIMNRDPSPIETYNDLDGNVVNFFKQLRDHPNDLTRLLHLTPYSREERRFAFERIKEPSGDLERARMFFVLARQTRSGMAQGQRSLLNSWRFTRDKITNGMGVYNHQWEDSIDGLAAVAARFRSIQIENYPWQRIIELYDTPDTLFYCDPPYVHETRVAGHDDVYAFEMTTADHRELSKVLHGIKGRAAVSGYPSELYDELYHDWHKVLMPVISTAGGAAQRERVEVLWTNYRTV
jgi:DNA adenine methylase